MNHSYNSTRFPLDVKSIIVSTFHSMQYFVVPDIIGVAVNSSLSCYLCSYVLLHIFSMYICMKIWIMAVTIMISLIILKRYSPSLFGCMYGSFINHHALLFLQINSEGVTRKFYPGDTLPLWHDEMEAHNSLLDILQTSSPEPMISWEGALVLALVWPKRNFFKKLFFLL